MDFDVATRRLRLVALEDISESASSISRWVSRRRFMVASVAASSAHPLSMTWHTVEPRRPRDHRVIPPHCCHGPQRIRAQGKSRARARVTHRHCVSDTDSHIQQESSNISTNIPTGQIGGYLRHRMRLQALHGPSSEPNPADRDGKYLVMSLSSRVSTISPCSVERFTDLLFRTASAQMPCFPTRRS